MFKKFSVALILAFVVSVLVTTNASAQGSSKRCVTYAGSILGYSHYGDQEVALDFNNSLIEQKCVVKNVRLYRSLGNTDAEAGILLNEARRSNSGIPYVFCRNGDRSRMVTLAHTYDSSIISIRDVEMDRWPAMAKRMARKSNCKLYR